jgi:hypothetical protein
MQTISDLSRLGQLWLFVAAILGTAGCNSAKREAYADKNGFSITPPADWVERARDTNKPVQKHQEWPLPPLGSAAQERLLVRYDRLTAGQLAWLRVTVAELPAAKPLKAIAPACSPGPGWKQEGDVTDCEIGGLPAIRVAFLGTWNTREYVCETALVRKGERVYLITGSFPAADTAARDQVRQAVAGASWQ